MRGPVLPIHESVKLAGAMMSGIAGLLLGGPGVAAVTIALLPLLLTACRLLGGSAEAEETLAEYRQSAPGSVAAH